MALDEWTTRDQRAAEVARLEARSLLEGRPTSTFSVDFVSGPSAAEKNRQAFSDARRRTLACIAADSFQAMMEVRTEVQGRDGSFEEKTQLWYASESSTTNEVFKSNGLSINVLAWSHPGVQLALSGELGAWRDVSASGYSLTGLEAKGRARFDAVFPQISGLYEPGGPVRQITRPASGVGLKAVKLAMSDDQVRAFVSRMDGLMIVTGAPGSGKTTVAFQRIRFLFDQQDQRDNATQAVPFTVERTRVFLANPNLVEYSRKMLVEQLDVPERVVAMVGPSVAELIDRLWTYRHGARPRLKNLTDLEKRARQAYFGLCRAEMLRKLWKAYEHQIGDRLRKTVNSVWAPPQADAKTTALADAFSTALAAAGRQAADNGNPMASAVRLDHVYKTASSAYESFRQSLQSDARNQFDEALKRHLFHVYDPLDALASAFGPLRMDGGGRIARGTGHQADEAQILDAIEVSWAERQYGPEEHAWLAWLLRFALSEVEDPQGQGRFREMPSALQAAGGVEHRLTHIAIDEAQDLSVVEASLLTSLVHPNGAVTVSADFRQAVNPTKGMEDASALSIGLPFHDARAKTNYRFGRNMRQSKQIGRFLQGFHEAAFGEIAPFDVNPQISDAKPRLILASLAEQPRRVAQLLKVLHTSGAMKSVAILQVNEHEESLMRLRAALERLGATLAPPYIAVGHSGVFTTSVERIKGLEFDACIVLGLEEAERASLNFTLNRAYVGLSRPARRLAMIAEHTPSILKKVNAALYDVVVQ